MSTRVTPSRGHKKKKDKWSATEDHKYSSGRRHSLAPPLYSTGERKERSASYVRRCKEGRHASFFPILCNPSPCLLNLYRTNKKLCASLERHPPRGGKKNLTNSCRTGKKKKAVHEPEHLKNYVRDKGSGRREKSGRCRRVVQEEAQIFLGNKC